jgi:hypothetical protein
MAGETARRLTQATRENQKSVERCALVKRVKRGTLMNKIAEKR